MEEILKILNETKSLYFQRVQILRQAETHLTKSLGSQTSFCRPIGRRRIRFPVAAKMALIIEEESEAILHQRQTVRVRCQ